MTYFRTGLDETLQEELLEAFNHIDKDKDGLLSPAEILALYKALGHVRSLCEVKESMSNLCGRPTNYITLVEFMNIIGRSLASSNCEYDLRESFRYLVKNDDQYANPNTFSIRLNSVAGKTSREEAAIILESADTDGDGRISVEEFIDIMRSGFMRSPKCCSEECCHHFGCNKWA
ncbi:putative N-acetyltransferase 8B [Clonorchis sinensis]|uniref:N-acetyltransferase 8B n=2 Tax=Clonorchis sinensis TaxID=79923 RepID=A0A3R7JHX0_CLOSI|nr:putative N-acetyltransferase 8B [Clonorchis sinensis]